MRMQGGARRCGGKEQTKAWASSAVCCHLPVSIDDRREWVLIREIQNRVKRNEAKRDLSRGWSGGG